MHSQKMRLISLNLVLVMLLTMLPVQAADIVIDDDGPMYTVVLNGNGGTYEGDDTLTISYGNRPLYLEDYIFTREGYTLLGWSKNEDASALDYTRFGELYAFDIGNDTQLYAVWGEGENCALYDYAPSEQAWQLGDYYVLNSATLSTVNDEYFVGWYDHFHGFYQAGDTVKAGEFYHHVFSYENPIILNGNGGKSNFGGELFYGGNYNRFDDRVHGSANTRYPCFTKDGYILDGWTTEADSNAIAAVSGMVFDTYASGGSRISTLYAHWSRAHQLINGTRLVIDGEERNELIESGSQYRGDGWDYSGTWHISIGEGGRTDFGDIALDSELQLTFFDDVTTGSIEANGPLRFSVPLGGPEPRTFTIQIESLKNPAIQAESVYMYDSDAIYQVNAEDAVGIDASYIYLGSPNITITGNPAVRDGAVIVCGSGICYTKSEDGSTLTTSAENLSVVLDGNGGTFNGEKKVAADYSVNNELDLGKYAFTREGYALIGWSCDNNGEKYYRANDGIEGKISEKTYDTLYAVWLKLPENKEYAIFETWDNYDIPNALSRHISSGWNDHIWHNGRTFYCVEIVDGFTMPNVSQNGLELSTIWQNKANRNLYYGGEIYTPASGSMFRLETSSANLGNGRHTIVLDGNGGTYRYTWGNNGKNYNVNRQVADSYVSNGQTVNYACNFTRPGYTLVSYNSEPDASGTEYALNKCTVTADMAPIQILYAQWKKIEESGQYITVDGKQYDAAQNWSGMGWEYRHYGNDDNEIVLNGYNGGTIESDMTLRVSCYNGKNYVTGGIRAPQLHVNISANGNSGGASLNLHAQKGAALISQGNMQINVQDLAELSVVGAEGYPAVSAGGELNLWLWREGRLSAQGGNTAAISAESINDNCGNDCVITAGTSSEDAAEVDRYTGQQYVSYKVRTKTLTLHGSGGTADGKDSISVDTKEGYLDLIQYANTFSNGGKVLLGWSRVENGTSVDYPNSSDAGFSFDSGISHADIYAVWDSNEQKGVVLNDYGQQFYDELNHYGGYNYFDQYTVLAAAGAEYTLPDSYKAGYRFLGWRSAQDGELYPAGTAITVEQSMTYTAEYEVLSMTINGKTYGMDKACGSSGIGWMFTPDGEYGYYNGNVELQIFENYSGKPIDVPSDVNIRIGGNITGSDGQPALSVNGNAYIHNGGGSNMTVTLIGGAEAPAVEATGKITLNNYYDNAALEFQGNDDQPALKAKSVYIDRAMLAGASAGDAVITGGYNGESYVCMRNPIATVTLQPEETVPNMPDAGRALFVAWRQENTGMNNAIWYRPGDVISGTEKTIAAEYSTIGGGAVILDCNGGLMNSGSEYCVISSTVSSAANLSMIKDTVLSSMHKTGYGLSGFNDNADGNGTAYTVEELFDNPGWIEANGEIKTFFAQWTKTGDPDTPAPDEPITTPDGSASYTVSGSTAAIDKVDTDKLITESNGKKSAELDLSNAGESVTEGSLPTDAVKTVSGSGAEKMTVKLPGASVSFDKKALSAIAAQSEGERVSLEVSIGDRNSLNTAQTNAVAKAKELSVIEVSLSSGNQKISDFNGGSVTIDVPFAWSMKGMLCAYYIDDSGNKSAIDVTYKNGVATLVLKHFSTYVIEIDKLQEPFVTVLPDSITVSVDNTVRTCVAAIYDEVGKLITLKTCEVVEDGGTVTIPCQMERLTGNRMLKVFFLDSKKSPCREAATLKATE